MDTISILLKCLKSKHIVNDAEKVKKEMVIQKVTLKKASDLFIRDAIMGMGTIMLEDLDKHYYITTVKIGAFGSVLAYAIIRRDETNAEIAAYAHEGLIKQHLAEKAIIKLSEVLC